MISREIAYIILASTLIAGFISIFFFTYVAKVEEEIIEKEIKQISRDTIKDISPFLSSEDKLLLKYVLKYGIPRPDMSEQDRIAEEKNKKVVNDTLMAFGIAIAIAVAIFLVIWLKYRFNLTDALVKIFVILVAVAVTELLFATYVLKNYILVDSNYANYTLLDRLQLYTRR